MPPYKKRKRNSARDTAGGSLFPAAGDDLFADAAAIRDEAAGGGERQMPNNPEAEQGLLASCIAEGGGAILDDCLSQKVSPAHFFDVRHGLVFEALTQLRNAGGGVIDEIMLAEQLRKNGHLGTVGGEAFIGELARRIEVTAHAPHWLAIVREKHFLRRLIETAQKTVERAYAPTEELQHLLDDVERSFFEISQDRISADSIQQIDKPAKDAVDMIHFLQANKGAVTGVPTGFKKLDQLCFGFHPGQMIVVAARPGMGKTSIALNFIEAALFRQNGNGGFAPTPTLMFSLEMPARELAMRLLCANARVNLRHIRAGFGKGRLDDIGRAYQEFSAMPLYIDDQGGQTILEIRAKARRLRQQHELGLIVIDYLQLINGTDPSVPREQQIAEASRSIKAMAKEFNLPVIALAQLNRKSEDEQRAPRISDLRESGSIEQDADMVLLIDKKRKGGGGKKPRGAAAAAGGEEEKEDEVSPDVVARTLIVAKHRNGPTDEIDLLFNRGLTKFEEPAKAEEVSKAAGF